MSHIPPSIPCSLGFPFAINRHLCRFREDIHEGLTIIFLSPALIFGLSGSIPFIGTSAATVYYAKLAGEAASTVTPSPGVDVNAAMATLQQIMEVEVTYGAVMLGFLGALHWGMEFAGYGGQKGSKRLMLGIAPTLVGWSTLALDPSLALAVQWAGFTGLWYADMKATAAGWSKRSQILFLSRLLNCFCDSSSMVFSIPILPLDFGRNLYHWNPRWNVLLWSYPIPFKNAQGIERVKRST